MPGFDGTGPRRMGPMTGGGRGFCAVPLPAAWPAYSGRAAYPSYGVPWGMPYYAGAPIAPNAAPFAPQVTREQELEFLKEQAEAIKEQLGQIEARIGQLGSEEE